MLQLRRNIAGTGWVGTPEVFKGTAKYFFTEIIQGRCVLFCNVAYYSLSIVITFHNN